jgi:hypothetical protein
MTNETIKALLMIAMFGLLETVLQFPKIRDLGSCALQAMVVFWPAAVNRCALRPIPTTRQSARPLFQPRNVVHPDEVPGNAFGI